ncbi:tripartite tricarboxylate transporter substrate binding protein [Nitratireductor sp. XY-223]|uniref:Bug family tripartite tricarboxylate transporter substrate binding protein n=1 Tax=Nitratireductor sp. XY-223 TaxID=2561926 RepID=UPI0010A9C4A4|nr:tripartite tricarboxylate transporter substrate binding protein [Nitratireductor sp. XY-223]
MMNSVLKILCSATALAICSVGAAWADYPDRTISLMVPFAAGGGADVPARFIAEELEKELGQSVVVSNVTGAGGTVGATQLSTATADGYSLGFMPVGTTTTQPHLRGTSYGVDSFIPICMVASGPFYLVVDADSGFKSWEDLEAKAKGDGITFTGAAPGSLAHVTSVALGAMWGVDVGYLPTKGGGDAMNELKGGRADATAWFSDFDVRFGLNALAIFAPERSEIHPDVPTSGDKGHPADIAVWMGLFAPAGTPADVVAKLDAACETAISSEGFTANMEKANREIRHMNTDEFSAFFRKAFEENGELLKNAGLVKN